VPRPSAQQGGDGRVFLGAVLLDSGPVVAVLCFGVTPPGGQGGSGSPLHPCGQRIIR